jgi:hypothetical protein
MDNYFNTEEQTNNLVVDNLGKSYVLDTARWGRFIGIVYLIAILLVCLIFPFILVNSPQYEALPSGSASFWAGFYIAAMIGMNFYPLYALIKSSTQAKKAITLNDQSLFTDSLRLTRNLYKYLGVLTIILICFYGLVIVFGLTMALTASTV